MRKSKRVPARPAVESMEARALMAGPSAPIADVINPVIEVGGATAFDPAGSRAVEVVVLGQAGVHPFEPAGELLPGTIRIDGIRLPGATVRRSPVGANGDGIPDAIVTIPTRSALRLPPGEDVLTITGRTRFRSGREPIRWASTATVDVLGGGGAGGGFRGTQSYVNGYVRVGNATGNPYNYTITDSYPGGGFPPASPGVSTPFPSGQVVTLNTGPGFSGPDFNIRVLISNRSGQGLVSGNFTPAQLTFSSFGQPSRINQYNLVLRGGSLTFARA